MMTEFFLRLFGSTNDVTVGQQCLRAVVVFIYGLALLRTTGRRMLGGWGSLDIIVAMILGSMLSRVVTASAPFVGTLCATTLIVALHWLVARACARWQGVSNLVEGSPVILVRDGLVLSGALRAHGISMSDLEGALRKESVEQPQGARRVTLEPSGDITIVKVE